MNLQLVDGWKKWYAMYSIWFFAAAGMAPDIWNLVVQSGLLTGAESPAALNRIMNVIALGGAIFRLVQQKVVAQAAAKDVAIRVEKESRMLTQAAELEAAQGDATKTS